MKEANKDILRAATILVKSLLVLDRVASDDGNSVVAHEVGMVNGALALLGNANHRNNLARRFVMKREINHKYSHLCSDRVPMTRFLFGDDVSQSAKNIEDSEKLKHKISSKKPPSTWRFPGGKTRGLWSKAPHRGFSSRYQPYGLQRAAFRGSHRPVMTRHDSETKNARSRGHPRPRQ